MKASTLIAALSLAGFAAVPAWAEHEGHRHGQSDAAPVAKVAGGKGLEDMKSGGKSCKKCKQGKSGGGHDHGGGGGGGGHDHGAADEAHDSHAGAEVEALRERVKQLEKRLDVMQTLLQVLVDRGRPAERGGGRGHH